MTFFLTFSIFLQSLRVVQARIQEIERQPTTKSAKDESELAQLHVKQHQILAAGRPVVQSGQTVVTQVLSQDFLLQRSAISIFL